VNPAEKLSGELGDRNKAVARALATVDGKVLMDTLERLFLTGDPGESDRELHEWLGARKLTLYLKRLREEGERKLANG